MEEVNFSQKIIIDSGKNLKIDLENYLENIFSLDNVDFVPYYLDNQFPGNRGGNSYVLKLVKAQEYNEDDGYPETPDMVIKICKFWKGKKNEHDRSQLFEREILALLSCRENKLKNITNIIDFGIVNIKSQDGAIRNYRFYTMPYAKFDLYSFLEKNRLSYIEKVELCLELCSSLKQLWSLQLYHRDIKPDNILFTENEWIMADLGLFKHRDDDMEISKKFNWIGPRGWMSPEAMNRYLSEGMPWSHLFDNKIDHQSDIFQLGKVFWYIFQGNSPEGGVRRNDFFWKDERVYQIVRTMINHSKRSRYEEIENVIKDLKLVYHNLIKKGEQVFLY